MLIWNIIASVYGILVTAYCITVVQDNHAMSKKLDEYEGISDPDLDMEGLAAIAERLRKEQDDDA